GEVDRGSPEVAGSDLVELLDQECPDRQRFALGLGKPIKGCIEAQVAHALFVDCHSLRDAAVVSELAADRVDLPGDGADGLLVYLLAVATFEDTLKLAQ